jgi:hypothetical protein
MMNLICELDADGFTGLLFTSFVSSFPVSVIMFWPYPVGHGQLEHMQHDQKPRLAQHIFKESIALVHHGQTSQW